jgi:Bacteriocin-protection, YdeI or OmpD-Associated
MVRANATLRIRSRMEITGVNPYVMVGAREASRLNRDWRGPMPVCFWVNGRSDKTWRINLMPVGDGRFRLYLDGDVRRESSLHVGDVLDIEARFDEEYTGGPLHPMPAWFDSALSRSKAAKRRWDRLSPSRQKEILRYFAQLKSPEARDRNLERAIHVLAGGRGRFMGRSWNEDGRQKPS